MPSKVFITHSSNDIDFARQLYSDLKAQGLDLWLDDKTLKAGQRLAKEISQALEWCDVHIPVLSRAALDSRWCWDEINAAIVLSNQRDRNERPQIVPVVVEECQVPALLLGRVYVNFTNRYDDALKDLLTKGFGVSLKPTSPRTITRARRITRSALNISKDSFDTTARPRFIKGSTRLFAELPPPSNTRFQLDNTSPVYYDSPYYLQHESQLQPVPLPRDPILQMNLADVVGQDIIQAIQTAKTITFHAVGDTGGTNSAKPNEESVTSMMSLDVRAGGPKAPAFLLHLGNVVFPFGESQYYYQQFYDRFRSYARPIFAIPGNHDGVVYRDASTSLKAFLRNFCSPAPSLSADAGGLVRTTMTQPGVYFTLDAPFVSIIGLYSNVLDGLGVISSKGGKYPTVSDAQLTFLQAELQRLKPAHVASERAIILAVHHPPLSVDAEYGGSSGLSDDIDIVCQQVGLWPDAILSGHTHLYQRFSRVVGDQFIPYIVCGTGGYSLSSPAAETPRSPFTRGDCTLDIDPVVAFGYLTITVDMTSTPKQLTIAFHAPNLGRNVDRLTVDLAHHPIEKTMEPYKSRARKKSSRSSQQLQR